MISLKYGYLNDILNIDNDVAWVLLSKLSTIIKGPLIILFIVVYLTSEQQGIWYTFISLSAISALAELGFSMIITQLVSHEFSDLRIEKGYIKGCSKSRERLYSLIKYAIYIYGVILPVAILLMLIAGYVILDKSLIYQWVAYTIVSALMLFVTVLQSVYHGMDKVGDVHRMKTIGIVILLISSCFFIYIGYGIWALVISTLISFLVMVFFLWIDTKRIWLQIYRTKIRNIYNWKSEIITLQGKYAVSWASGYFIFQLFVPFVYKIEGAVMAGQLGVALSLVKSISSISSSWLDSKIPKINMCVARKDKSSLDRIFAKYSLTGYLFFCLGAIGLLTAVYIINQYDVYAERMLDTYYVFLLILVEFATIKIGYLAKYLRAHKAEPFYMLSLLNGALVFFVVYTVLPIYKIEGLFYSLIIIYWLIILPLAFIIFKGFTKQYYSVV